MAGTQNYTVHAVRGKILRPNFCTDLEMLEMTNVIMQLQTAKQQKHESPREFLDRCRSLAMNTVPKVEDPLLQKFHYDQVQRCYCRHL